MSTQRPGQLTLGEVLRDEGMERVAEHNTDWLSDARREAARVCARQGVVSAVEVRQWADRANDGLGYYPDHPNAWGSIFRGPQWQATGEWVQCQHPDGHARSVRVWRYVSTVR